MQTKLKLLVTICLGMMIGTSAQASTGYCAKNIVHRSVTQYSIGQDKLAELCKSYDKCSAKSTLAKSRCDRQFAASAQRQCHKMYGSSKTELGVCSFSVKTYSKLLQRYARD